MTRRRTRLHAFVCMGFLLASLPASARARERTTQNVVLVTVDGLRCEELFSGLDEKMLTDAESKRQIVESGCPERRLSCIISDIILRQQKSVFRESSSFVFQRRARHLPLDAQAEEVNQWMARN